MKYTRIGALLVLSASALSGPVAAQIPQTEREALVALYNSTDGANWRLNGHWLEAAGTECTWYGVTCSGGHVQNLGLSDNDLDGVIPSELGDLSNLTVLDLDTNYLNGSIPPRLGELQSLQWLILQYNQLSGPIPPQLGNLLSLEHLTLGSNLLSGTIPPELEDLSTLTDGSGLDLRWNALHSDNASLTSFLDSKQLGGNWRSTQTVAPENPVVDWVGDHTLWLSWDPPNHNIPGGFEVFVIPATGGSWTSVGWTTSKTELEIPATALDPGISYELAVATHTHPHSDNQNLVTSDPSEPVMATTADLGCAQPVITTSWADPVTLSLPGTFDSYLWNTGETTSTINVSPNDTRWYWVTVTSSGSCQESAIILVDLQKIFTEYSDTSGLYRIAVAEDGPSQPRPIPVQGDRGAVSPDGRWLAYDSLTTGRREIYLQPFPEGGAVVPVSSKGGAHPRWSSSGTRLYYNSGCDFFAVDIGPGTELELGTPRLLFEHCDPTSRQDVVFNVDSQDRFYLLEAVPDSGVVNSLDLVQNWDLRVSAALGEDRPRD